MRLSAVFLAALLFASSVAVAGETMSLPAPMKKGGPDLFTAIDNRASASQGNFPKGELSREDVATILWAATGKNRDGKKWTVPMGMGTPPYCKVYYADKQGAYQYDWNRHTLVKITDRNIVPDTVTQGFAQEAPALIFIVEDAAEKAKIMSDAWRNEFTILLAGAMSQNIYLAAQGVGVGARLVYSVDREAAHRLLKLPSGDKVFFAIVLGKG